MELQTEILPSGVTVARLTGRMDIEGAAAVDLQMNTLAGRENKGLIVDLQNVSFMASMGLRTLMLCARTMVKRGRPMALVGAQANVEKVMRSSGIDEFAAIYATVDAAVAAIGT